MLGMGLLLASCTGDYKDWADPQSNPDEGSKSVSFTVAPAAAIDYASIGDSVQLFVPTVVVDDEVINTFEAELFNADKSASVVLNADGQGRVLSADLKSAVQQLYGKAPEARTIDMDITAYTNINGQSIKNLGTSQTTVTLRPRDVADSYTLVLGSKEFAFTRNAKTNKYDDPIFKCTFESEGDTESWTLKSSDNVVLGVVPGSTDEGGFNGSLASEGYQAGSWDVYGKFIMTIDMESYTFHIEEAPAYEWDFIWQAGNANGWGSPASPLAQIKQDTGEYQGFMYLNGEFKFRSQESSWDAPDWGGTDDGTLVQQGGNLSAEEGFYKVDVNLSEMKYKLTEITTIGVIGGFDGNSWGSDVAKLTYNIASGAWEGTANIPAGVEFKFRANDDWAVNWGGAFDNLAQDGGNLKLDASGTYTIKLYVPAAGLSYVEMTLQ